MLRCLFGPQHSHGGPNRGPIPLLASTWMLFKGICASYLLNYDARLVEFPRFQAIQPLRLTGSLCQSFPKAIVGISLAFAMYQRNSTATASLQVWEASDSRSAWCPLVALLLLLICGRVRPTHALSRAAI